MRVEPINAECAPSTALLTPLTISEKTLMKNVPMCNIGVTEGKIENLKKKQNED